VVSGVTDISGKSNNTHVPQPFILALSASTVFTVRSLPLRSSLMETVISIPFVIG